MDKDNKQISALTCPNCHKAVLPQDKFCIYCGTELPTFKTCEYCHKTILSNDNFCIYCGNHNDEKQTLKDDTDTFETYEIEDDETLDEFVPEEEETLDEFVPEEDETSPVYSDYEEETAKPKNKNKIIILSIAVLLFLSISIFFFTRTCKINYINKLDPYNHINNPTSYKVTDFSVDLNEPTLTGYKFLGWYVDDDSNKKIDKLSIGCVFNKELNLYAKWELIYNNISYDLNGGNCSVELPDKYSILDTIYLPEPKKDGFVFDGWFDQNDNRIYVLTGVNYNGDLTLKAKWADKVYKINYLNVDGAVNNNFSTYSINNSVTFKSITKDGYEFKGWYLNNITWISSTNDQEGDINVYAKWEPIKYKITYKLDGGTNNSNPSKYTVEDGQLKLNDPVKKGYSFSGWYTSTGLRKTYLDAKRDKAITLEARWSAKTYRIKYENTNGASGSYPTTYTINSPVVLSNLTREGYSFDCWTLPNNQTIKTTSGLCEDITVRANWTPIKYSVSYNLNGGINDDSNPSEYTVEDGYVKLNDPVKYGYSFSGWYTSNGEKRYSLYASRDKSIALEARWSVKTYRIKYENTKSVSASYPTTYTINSPASFPELIKKDIRLTIGHCQVVK